MKSNGKLHKNYMIFSKAFRGTDFGVMPRKQTTRKRDVQLIGGMM